MKNKPRIFEIGRVALPPWTKKTSYTVSKVRVCGEEFEKLTGQKLKPGEVGRFKLVRVK